jgi:hypothetical protein
MSPELNDKHTFVPLAYECFGLASGGVRKHFGELC